VSDAAILSVLITSGLTLGKEPMHSEGAKWKEDKEKCRKKERYNSFHVQILNNFINRPFFWK
jgi:hypothetical protein